VAALGGQESEAFRMTGETEEWILKSPLCHAELVSASIINSRMWVLKQVQEDRGKLKGMDPEINSG